MCGKSSGFLPVVRGASLLKSHHFYVGQAPGCQSFDAWMADRPRLPMDWWHSWDHLGLGSERLQGPEPVGRWEMTDAVPDCHTHIGAHTGLASWVCDLDSCSKGPHTCVDLSCRHLEMTNDY